MIQNFFGNIKKFLKKNNINFLEPLTLDEFTSLENYYLNHLNLSNSHSHMDNYCKSHSLTYFRSYERSYITFQNASVIEETCLIHVVYCDNCNHYHSILFNFAIIPYCQYSIFFVLCVLYDKLITNLTVEEIIHKYQISVSTLYRWVHRYSSYLRIYTFLRHKYKNSFLISLLNHYEDLILELFDCYPRALFQYDRKLSQPPSG